MNKKLLILIIVFILAVSAIMTKQFTMLFDFRESAKIIEKSVQFQDDFSKKPMLVAAVDHIFIGEVLREDGFSKGKEGMETQFIVGITQNIKGALLGEIKLKQKGGYYKESGKLIFERYEKDNLLKQGQMYMFAVHYDKMNGTYEMMPKYGYFPLNDEEQKYKLIAEMNEALK